MSEEINVSVLPEFVDNALQNLTDKPSKSMGETFSDIWYLILGGKMEYLAEKKKMKYAKALQEYKELIEREIDLIPEQRRREADIHTIGPILESSKYCAEKEKLRSMFAKLIASSMDSNRVLKAHPLFSFILNHMSEMDAMVFKAIAENAPDIIPSNTNKGELKLSVATLTQFGIVEPTDIKDIKIKPKTTGDEKKDALEQASSMLFTYAFSKVYDTMRNKAMENLDNKTVVTIFRLTELGNEFKEVCI